MEEESESERVKELIKKQVADWDDEVMSRARFKALSGQRSDWQPLYLFWKHLVLAVARHLGIFVISNPPRLKHRWFSRGGLTPLSLDHVLFEMYKEGEIVPSGDLVDPTAGRVSQIFTRLSKAVLASRITTPELLMSHDRLIITSLLQDKSAEVVRLLSDSECHWTSSCVVTMKRFRDVCGGPVEASAVLSHLSAQGKARYLSLSMGDFIEGVKISLSASSVAGISSLDCDVLHLIWTTEKLEQQLNVIDQRYQTSRKSALACLKSGNKKVALRHARELKLANESREKCATLLNRVEEILAAIASAESTKKVSEAIKSGAQAMKENKISVEEVEHSLQEVEEAIDVQKQVENALESTSLYTDDEESIEEEFKKLELEIGLESLHEPLNVEVNNAESSKSTESTESLIDSMSNLKLVDDNLARTTVQGIIKTRQKNKTENLELETA